MPVARPPVGLQAAQQERQRVRALNPFYITDRISEQPMNFSSVLALEMHVFAVG